MGQYANFYNSVNGDRVYDASSFEEWLAPFFKNGVFADCLQVTALENMNISVSSGSTYINGKTKTFDVSTTLTLSTANSTLARIDNIVIRRNDEDRDFFIMVQEGAYANQPTAPQPIRTNSYYDIVLAHVYVAPSVVEITQADITDTRMDENLCGYVVGLIDQIDFNQIKAQFDAWLSQVQGDLQDILQDGSVINDSSSSNLTTYSSNKIEQLVDGLELPTASATTKGGIKVGSGLSMDGDTMSATVDLSNYYTKAQTYTKTEVNTLLNNLPQIEYEVLETL